MNYLSVCYFYFSEKSPHPKKKKVSRSRKRVVGQSTEYPLYKEQAQARPVPFLGRLYMKARCKKNTKIPMHFFINQLLFIRGGGEQYYHISGKFVKEKEL